MAERHRSADKSRDTDEFLEGEPKGTSRQGRAGGNLARKVATKDELRHATNDSAGATRKTKADEDRPENDFGERNK